MPAEEDAVSEVSEAELREWLEEQGAGTGAGRRAKGELATCRHRADSGQETDCT